MNNPDDERDWLNAYLDALPDNIRPTPTDQRFLNAAATAYRNGWTGRQAANVIKTRDYRGKTNPTLVAIMELERAGDRPPATLTQRQPTRNASGCTVCPPTVTCNDPVTERTPPAWVAERMGLLRELMRTPDMSEDEREDCMRVLIAVQRNNHTKAQ